MTSRDTMTPLAPWLADTHASTFDALQAQWLVRPGALTAGLRALWQLELTVLREYPATLANPVAWMIQGQGRDDIWVRDIYMSIDGNPCVPVRSCHRLRRAQA